MVRLRQLYKKLELIAQKLFQSHNGSIATQIGDSIVIVTAIFQSHNGSIATPFFIFYSYFFDIFQSHNGSIATASYASVSGANTSTDFNPIMVRLRQVSP